MDGARGLEAAKGAGEERVGGGHGWRHGKAGDARQWERDKDHDGVGDFLELAVLGTASGRANFEAEMMFEIVPKVTSGEIGFARPEMAAEMAREDAGEEIGEAGCDENPCGEKMEAAAPAILVVDVEGAAGA